jgi:hypothetical protein
MMLIQVVGLAVFAGFDVFLGSVEMLCFAPNVSLSNMKKIKSNCENKKPDS